MDVPAIEGGVIIGLLLAGFGVLWRELLFVRKQLTKCVEERGQYKALAETANATIAKMEAQMVKFEADLERLTERVAR